MFKNQPMYIIVNAICNLKMDINEHVRFKMLKEWFRIVFYCTCLIIVDLNL